MELYLLCIRNDLTKKKYCVNLIENLMHPFLEVYTKVNYMFALYINASLDRVLFIFLF